ncbi:uncharacterized protein PADG_05147 [Paracoccidioides brasiliensis Pb18]|uniref:Uncharacterized protein n=1 Tax=Paracoccidioides brasiliensis (strain Pb18) TaxID=502780 RepID=C1GD11_PARBD|nr:uncharacterized protein PADG_05147 [Paracoccidioides brasiliensis Pb18]EEH49068.2 hypothetical protein PADG_05147 [Paracoccidioides brasiliensis Pb18]
MGNVVGATPKAAFDLVNGKTFVALATAALGAGVEVVEFRVVVGEPAERKTVMVTVQQQQQQQQQQPERKIDIEIEMLRATRMGEILQGIKRSRFTRGFTSERTGTRNVFRKYSQKICSQTADCGQALEGLDYF